MLTNHHHQRAIEYIRNAGGRPQVVRFDDDHDPIGPQLRGDLEELGLIDNLRDPLDGNCIKLTAKGDAELPT